MISAELRECLALVDNKVPWDIAFSLDNNTRTAMLIIFGEMHGGVFSWSTGQWEPRK
jgi:hypothetical protein